MSSIKYLGHASLLIEANDKVIYVDPFAGDDYKKPADIILVTHEHFDHNQVDKVPRQPDECWVLRAENMLVNNNYKTMDFDDVQIQAVKAGNNPNHDIKKCVGYIIAITPKKKLFQKQGETVRIYVSGDTSTTDQMVVLDGLDLDYAFFCCDGVYNMDVTEASECAKLVNAKHSIPYHTDDASKSPFKAEVAEAFEAKGKIILKPGEKIEL